MRTNQHLPKHRSSNNSKFAQNVLAVEIRRRTNRLAVKMKTRQHILAIEIDTRSELPSSPLCWPCCQIYCDNENTQLTDLFFIKITQLYEMIIVRHGLMLVGYSYGAKTCMYRTLAATATTTSTARATTTAAQRRERFNLDNQKKMLLTRNTHHIA